MDTPWLTKAEAAAYLKVTTRTIERYVAESRIRQFQLVAGGDARYLQQDLDDCLWSQVAAGQVQTGHEAVVRAKAAAARARGEA